MRVGIVTAVCVRAVEEPNSGWKTRMNSKSHNPANPGGRFSLPLWCLLGGFTLLLIPAHLAAPAEFLHLMLAPLPSDRDVSIVAGYAWFSLPAVPLIPLFLAWVLPGASSPGRPRRSIAALCLLIAYHPLRLYFDSYDYDTAIANAVAEISRGFPLTWTFRHLDTPFLIGLAVWAIFRRHTLRPKEKVVFHWGLFVCALWAAGPLSNDYFDFVLTL